MKILSFLETFISKMKRADIFNFLSVKYFGKILLLLKIWHIESTIVKLRAAFEYKAKSWIICPCLRLFFQKCWYFEFSWMKYFGNDFSFLIKWHIWVYYCWNYGPSNLKAELKANFWFQIGIYPRKNRPRHGSGQLPPVNN